MTTQHAGTARRATHRPWRLVVLAVLTAGLMSGVGGAVAQRLPQAVSNEPLVTVGVSPYRVLDTRLGIGVGGATSPVGPDGTIDVQIAGIGPVPANAVGIVLNLTANAATEPGYVTAWPSGEARPTASVLNLTPGIDSPNMITAALGDGRISLYNFTGTVHLIADVAAYLIPGTGGGGIQGPAGPPGPSGIAPQQTLVLSAAAASSSGVISSAGCLNSAAQTHVDIALPAGAQITAVRVSFDDASASAEFFVWMDRTDAPRAPVQSSDTFRSGIAFLGSGTASLALTADVVPVAENARYILRTVGSPAAVWFCGAAIDYTMPAA
jgi:hypothetical protein